ncbi:hypothetical protein ABK040_003713 [Willaertia magna]
MSAIVDQHLSFKISVDGYNMVTTKDKNSTVIYDVTFVVKRISNTFSSPTSPTSTTSSSSMMNSLNTNSSCVNNKKNSDGTLFSLQVQKRYTEMRELYKKLNETFPELKLSFPPKLLFGNTNPETIERRKSELQLFFDQLTNLLSNETINQTHGTPIYDVVLPFFEDKDKHYV